jgi:Tfp pilus assembly PilM family ATPase
MSAHAAGKSGDLGKLARLRAWLFAPPVPFVAVEVRERSLGAVRMAPAGRARAIVAAATVPLPDGALSFSMLNANIADPEGFRASLRALLERVGGLTETHIALVLPDPVARVMVLAAPETRAARKASPQEMLRFRLHGKLPFDVREARLSEVALAGHAGNGASLVVAVHRQVIENYEETLHSAGLEAGLIEVCALALDRSLGDAAPDEDRLLINWDEHYISFVLSRQGAPALVRTLAASARLGDVVREVASTLLYYRERLGGTALTRAHLRSCALPVDQAVGLLAEPLGFPPQVVGPSGLGETLEIGATAQAIAGAAACIQAAP